MPKVGDKGPGGKVWAGDDFGWQNPQTVWKGQKPGSKAGETRTLPGLGTKVWTGKDYGWQSQSTIDARKKGAQPAKPSSPSATTPASPPTSKSQPSPSSSSSFTWDPNKNIIAAKGGKLGIMDKGDPKSWRQPSEQEKGEIPISSTNAFRNSPAGQAFIKQRDALKGTSSAPTSSSEKIRSGLQTYQKQIRTGNIKGAEKTGKETWALANPKLAAAAAERERTRGTSATTNPQMADLKSRLPAPKTTSSGTPTPSAPKVKTDTAVQRVQTVSQPAAKSIEAEVKKRNIPTFNTNKIATNLRQSYEYDAYDLVLEYLFDNGHVDSIEEANYVMLQMDENTIGSIVEEKINEITT